MSRHTPYLVIVLLFLSAFCVPLSAAEIYHLDASTGQPDDWAPSSTSGTVSFTYDDVYWIIEGTKQNSANNYSWDWDNTEIDLGSGRYPLSACSVSTSDLTTYPIDKVVVNTRGGSGVSATVAVSVGGVAFTCAGSTTAAIGSSATDYTFESAEGVHGDVVITYSQPSTPYALYLREITIYSSETQMQLSALAYSTSFLGVYVDEILADSVTYPTLTYDEAFTSVDAITYTSSDPTIATVDDDGTVVCTGQPGTTAITASFAGDDTFLASASTYTLRVKTGQIHTFDFDLYTYSMTVYDEDAGTYEQDITTITGRNGVVISLTGTYGEVSSFNEGNHLRMLSNSTWTITSPADRLITRLIITGTGQADNINSANPKVNGENMSYAEHVCTWQGTPTTAISVSFSGTTHIAAVDVLLDTGTFTITDAEYATYYTDAAYIMPEGVAGSTITGVGSKQRDEGYALIMPWDYAEGATVPANTPLVLHGAAGTYTYAITTSSEETPAENLLRGAITAVYTTGPDDSSEGYLFYELTNGEHGIGFYYGAAEGGVFLSYANKAWLPLTEEQGQHVRFIGFDDEESTGITTIPCYDDDNAIYTLQGVRVSSMKSKGIYIVKGRKIIAQ